MYGPHLILEAYGCNPKSLGNVGHLYRVLDNYPAKIGMTKIMPPHVQQYLSPPLAEWGVSGFVMIAESHIAIHTYPMKGFLALDIFSCKDFEAQPAIDYIVGKYKIQKYDHKLFHRGEHFPQDVAKCNRIVGADRRRLKVV